jgi:hypothetical protein
MTIRLNEEDSIAYLFGGWDALAVEEYVLQDLALQGIDAPVVVVLSDGTVAFYVAEGRTVV